VKIRRAQSAKSKSKSKKVRKKVRIKKPLEEGWPVNGSVGKTLILDQRHEPQQEAAVLRLIRKKAGKKARISVPVLIPLNGTIVTCKQLALRMAVHVDNLVVGTVSLASPKSSKLVWRDQGSFGFFAIREDNLPDKPS
jgi:hypothetical protein